VSTLSLPSGVYRSTSISQRFSKVWLPALLSALDTTLTIFSAPKTREPRTVAELLDYAQQHEASEPAFAAELRAAALNHEARQQSHAARF
jgi:hypothetical protein